MGSRSTPGNTEPEKKAAPRARATSKTSDTAKTGAKSAAKPAGTRAAKAGPAEAAVKAPKKPAQAKAPRLSADDRHRLIAEAAYYSAERRGFDPGMELEDWLKAETEVDRLLADTAPATH